MCGFESAHTQMSPKKLPDGSGFSIFGFEHWSLALKETTQSTIVRKLSATPQQQGQARVLGIRQHSSQPLPARLY